ncbi:hypothetical protein CJD36_022720 [Flavipsychrobacter stenotrophus]|uniref:PASTA domain-containing protein n=1 Tax=Flavipsychrobacter stenotrophus TaxID=2077091 RepID=A0A2S7SPC1_9BACT|nr:PASTA domain-containing protein [Flavipsychrobacter stenotrophus]PQJ08742.1 hypothetical protein CJD36_022720 [Flavipsychrobacter stenotrophus]
MKEEVKRSFWFNFLVVAATFTGIYIIFFWALGCLTHHGEMVKIPNLKGKHMNEAIAQLHDMHFDVHVDSTYDPLAKPLAVLKQVPDTGSTVKSGRIVMITVNSVTPMRVPMPNLISLSFRSAEMLLKNNKMFVGDTTYVPDIARGAIKEQRFKGHAIRPGEMIPQGSRIDLVIGNGLGNTDLNVPDLVHMTVDEATAIVNANNLILNLVVESGSGEIYDTPNAFIIRQVQKPLNDAGQPSKIKMGDIIDVFIKQKPEPDDYEGGNKPPIEAVKDKTFDPEDGN